MVGPTERRSLALRRRARAGLLSAAIALLAGPAASDAVPAPETPPVPEASDPLDAGTIDARIREIETAIARDEKALKAWVARRGEEDTAEAFAANPELREIAKRLPRLQSQLRSLRQQRATLESP